MFISKTVLLNFIWNLDTELSARSVLAGMGRSDRYSARSEIKDIKSGFKNPACAKTKYYLSQIELSFLLVSYQKRSVNKLCYYVGKKLYHSNWLPERSVFCRFNTSCELISQICNLNGTLHNENCCLLRRNFFRLWIVHNVE